VSTAHKARPRRGLREQLSTAGPPYPGRSPTALLTGPRFPIRAHNLQHFQPSPRNHTATKPLTEGSAPPRHSYAAQPGHKALRFASRPQPGRALSARSVPAPPPLNPRALSPQRQRRSRAQRTPTGQAPPRREETKSPNGGSPPPPSPSARLTCSSCRPGAGLRGYHVPQLCGRDADALQPLRHLASRRGGDGGRAGPNFLARSPAAERAHAHGAARSGAAMGSVRVADVGAAMGRLRGRVHRTPVLTCGTLQRLAGRRLLFKCELFQRTGSFKV